MYFISMGAARLYRASAALADGSLELVRTLTLDVGLYIGEAQCRDAGKVRLVDGSEDTDFASHSADFK
jgi:hypothetical protein